MYQRGWKLLLLGAVASVYSTPALGTTYNLKDNPECALEDAIKAVTTQEAVGACEAGTGNDRILLVQNKTYELKEQLVLGGGTTFVEEKVLDEEGEEVIGDDGEPEIELEEKPIRNITLRIETAAEPGQRNEDRETATIKAATDDRVFWIHGSNTLSLEHIRLEGGDVTGNPLVVEWTQHAQPASSEDSDTYTYSLNRFSQAPFGGAVFVEGTLITRTHVEIEGGKARKGGAIYLNGVEANLAYATVKDAEAEKGELIVEHVVDSCSEGCEVNEGPQVAWGEQHYLLETSYQDEFEKTASGGGVHIQKGRLVLTQTQFDSNKAVNGVGGAIATDAYSNATVTADGAYFANNQANTQSSDDAADKYAGLGGAIFFAENATGITNSAYRIEVKMVNTLFHDNWSADKGAALHFSALSDTSKILLNNLTVFRNRTAGSGAGVWFEEPLTQGYFLNSLVLANMADSLKRAHRSDINLEDGGVIWECFEDPQMVEESEPEQAITYCAKYVEVDENNEPQEEIEVWANPNPGTNNDKEDQWFVFIGNNEATSDLDDIGRFEKEWKTYGELDEKGRDLVAEELKKLAGFIFEAPDKEELNNFFPDDKWNYPSSPTGDKFEIRRQEASDPVITFRRKKNDEEEYEYEVELNMDDEEKSKLLLRHYYVIKQEEDGSWATDEAGNLKSEPAIDFVAWLDDELDFDDEPSELFEPANYEHFQQLKQSANVFWSNKSMAIVAGEKYQVTGLGWLKKKNDNDVYVDVYVDKNGGLTPSNDSDPRVENIGQVEFINHLDSSVVPYLWHGQNDNSLTLDEKKQARLLRGKDAKDCGKDCEPVTPEDGLPYFSINPIPEDPDDVDGFTLLASGAPYVGSSDANVCESKDMRGFTRQDRCDAGAVDFQRALGEKDTFFITVGGKDTFDVLKNDLGDADVDCNRVTGFKFEDKETYDSCLKVVIKSTREGVKTTTVVDEESGYPRIEYDSGSGFHGHDYFEYRVSKEAFPRNTTLGANDVGARVAVVSEPGSGIKSESVDQIGSAHFAWLLGLLGLGLARRGNTKRYALALGALALSAFPAAHAAEVKVSKDKTTEESTQYPVDVCTLRAAIASTEAPPTNTACSQGSGGVSRDVILLPAGEFVLWDTLKVNQNNPIEIRGEGPDKTTITMRDEDDFCARLFETESALTLSNLTLEGGCVQSDSEGRGGAALYAYGLTPPSVAMSNVHVKGNKAEGANGGAVFLAYRADNKAEATFDKVFFEGNKAANGGAIYVDAIVDSSRNAINITNSTFTKNKATASGNAIATASGKNVRLNIINSLFFKNENENENENESKAAVDLSNHRGSTYVLNSTFIGNKDAFKFDVEPARFALHNSVVSDEVGGSLSDFQASYNLLAVSLDCDSSNGSGSCAKTSDNNEFLGVQEIEKLHEDKLSALCDEEDNEGGCLEGERWFVPYLPVKERHLADGNASDSGGDSTACGPPVEDEGGSSQGQGSDKVCKIIERGNPAPLQTGISTPTSCRTTDMRGKTREAGGQCDRGAFEVQTNTAMPDIGNNSSRKSRTALLNVLRNDITGDDTKGSEMYIRPGTLRAHKIKGKKINGIDVNDQVVSVTEEEVKANLEKHFGDKNEKLSKFLKQGKTKGELIVVKAEMPGAELGLGSDPVPQYYDDITIINADGREDSQSTGRAFDSKYQCTDEDKDEECLVFYEAPKNYLCSDLPFEDYFAYSVESWEVESWKEVPETDANGKELKDDSGKVIMVKEPEFVEDAMTKLFTGYVQVTIDNIPPIVPREGIKYRIDPGGTITIDLDANGVKPIEGGVDDERPIKIENLTLEKEPQFALYNGRTHEVLGTGLFLDKENLTVTYHHGDVTKTFADTFSVKVTDSCGASSIVPIRIEFHGADDAGGSTPWALTLLLVAGGAVRRRFAKAKAA